MSVWWGRSLVRWGGCVRPKMRPWGGHHLELSTTARSHSPNHLLRCHTRCVSVRCCREGRTATPPQSGAVIPACLRGAPQGTCGSHCCQSKKRHTQEKEGWKSINPSAQSKVGLIHTSPALSWQQHPLIQGLALPVSLYQPPGRRERKAGHSAQREPATNAELINMFPRKSSLVHLGSPGCSLTYTSSRQ